MTEPVLVQSCLIGGVSSAVFSSFWVSSTFLLGDVYSYSSLEIGLYALIGIVGVSLAPFIGKAIDKLGELSFLAPPRLTSRIQFPGSASSLASPSWASRKSCTPPQPASRSGAWWS